MKGKKILSTLVVMMLMATLLTTSAFAVEEPPKNSTDTASISVNATQMSPELQARFEELMNNKNNLRSGQNEERTVLSDGTVLYVTEVDKESAVTRVAKTTSRSFMIQSEGIFGTKKDGFQVDFTCEWNENGKNSSITTLRGVYTIYDKNFSLYWDEDNAWSEPSLHMLPLDVYYKGNYAYYIGSAMLDTLSSPVTCDIEFGVSNA